MYLYNSERMYDKLEFRDLWVAVGKLTSHNNDWKYQQLDDEQKDCIKTIFQVLNEEVPNDILYIESGNRSLIIKINNDESYLLDWYYDHIRFVKRRGRLTIYEPTNNEP